MDKDVPFILLMNDGKTRPVDARALTFLHRFDALTTVVDAKDYGLGNAVDSSVIMDYTISGHECSAFKPDPEIYLRAMEALGVEPAECLVIEDSPLGIEAGKRSGARVLALRPHEGCQPRPVRCRRCHRQPDRHFGRFVVSIRREKHWFTRLCYGLA